MPFSLHLPLLIVALAGDSVSYPVLNHDRVAGSMVVARHGDSVTVRYVFTDRNRGTRVETRYAIRDGRVVFTESHPVLADGRIGDATSRLEVTAESVRNWTPTKASAERRQPDVYYGAGFTPFDQVTLAKYLLHQPQHTTTLAGQHTTTRLEVLRVLTVPTPRGNERVRLVAIDRRLSRTDAPTSSDPASTATPPATPPTTARCVRQ